jgi:hypothetical protein
MWIGIQIALFIIGRYICKYTTITHIYIPVFNYLFFNEPNLNSCAYVQDQELHQDPYQKRNISRFEQPNFTWQDPVQNL